MPTDRLLDEKALADARITFRDPDATVAEVVTAYLAALPPLAPTLDMCDVCAGTGNPLSGKPCICGGVGTMSAELQGFRALAYDLQEKLDVPLASPSRPFTTLAEEINEINRANGWAVVTPDEWGDTYKIPGILALIHSEVSEALEGFRHNDRANFDEELADVLIRVLDCAGGLGIDLDAQVAAKLTKNRARGFKHGGKRV